MASHFCFVSSLHFAVSVSGKRGVGIPVILLHDAEGGVVTVEMKDGSLYRGLLDEAQDNMNLTLKVSVQNLFPHSLTCYDTLSFNFFHFIFLSLHFLFRFISLNKCF